MNPKIKAARRKHKLKRDLGGWLAILAIIVVAICLHRVQWAWAMAAGLSVTEACFVIVLAWLCVIGFVVVPAWRYLTK